MNKTAWNSTVFTSAFLIALAPGIVWSGMLTISIESTQFSPGSAGTVDVWISSDGADTLNRFNFEFRIDPVGATATELQFLDPQSDSQLSNAGYVFSTGSLKRDGQVLPPPFPGFPPIIIAPTPVGSVSTTTSPNDTFIGSDVSTANNVSLGATPRLLAELDLVSGSGTLAPNMGDSFTISLIAGPNTVFHPDSSSSTLDYTSSSGTITFASAVPEPSGLALMAFGSLALLTFGLRRFWQKQKSRVPESARLT